MDGDKSSQSRLVLSSGLLLIWLLGSAYAFWWFQFKDLRPFTDTTNNKSVFFEGAEMQVRIRQALAGYSVENPGDVKKTVLLHFWDPECPCSAFSEQHVRQLMDEYRQKGIRFLVVVKQAGDFSRAELEQKVEKVFGKVDLLASESLALGRMVPSSPAAVILDSRHELAYFGPYSEGAVCSVGGGRFVERVLDRVIKGDNPRFINTLAYGCFCDWQRPAKRI